MTKEDLIRKITSRKFLIAAAAFLAALGAGLAGVADPNVCAICMAVSAAIYAACEAYVDGAAAKANQTMNSTTVNGYFDATDGPIQLSSEDE